MEKMEGMQQVRALAQHHAHILMAKLHRVCLALIEEVLNTFSCLALCFSCCARLKFDQRLLMFILTLD